MFLIIEVIQDLDGGFISQRKYALDLLKKFSLENCNSTKTPMNAIDKFSLKMTGQRKCFKSIVGSPVYLTHTRPDLMFSLSLISKLIQNPSKTHLGCSQKDFKICSRHREL